MMLDIPFWRSEPFSEIEKSLVSEVMFAHHESSFRNNISSVTVVNCKFGSGDYCKSIAGALMTIGESHAPIEQCARLLLSEDVYSATKIILSTGKVPGFGSSFHKACIDPDWIRVDILLRQNFGNISNAIDQASKAVRHEGFNIEPNPAMFTAACAIAIGMPPEISPMLLIAGRLEAWTNIFLHGKI